MISENLKLVYQNIINACKKSDREPSEVTLVAVSKTKPLTMVTECMEAGTVVLHELSDDLSGKPYDAVFGENYVQELVEKYEALLKEQPALAAKLKWHMIGHLQRNKVKYIIDKVAMIHSVDSMRLADQIEAEASKQNLIMDILLEINIAQEASKWGFTAAEALETVLTLVKSHSHLRIRGFMTSAPYTEDPESNRIHFHNLHALFLDTKKALSEDNALSSYAASFDTLSMGMTGDYTVAVEEGATMVRVGTGIFGERDYH